ncbi:hypothetical protein KCU78_g6598, partial [Aureobasidium melanogenum]
MPPKGPPRKPLLYQKPLANILPKPSSMSRAGVFSSSSDDGHDISPPTSTERNSPTQPPSEEAELSTSVAPEWAHAGVRVPTMDSYAPAPAVPALAPFVFGNWPSYLSLTSLEVGAASPIDSMFWDQRLGYDQRLAYEQVDMQAYYSMYGAVNEIQQDSSEPPLMSTPRSHQVPAASHSSEHMLSWQTGTDGYDSAYTRSCPTYTPLALEENSAYSQSHAVNSLGSAPPAMTQSEAGTWDTEPSGNMREAPVSFIFTQQTPSSIAVPINHRVTGDAWRGYSGTGMPGPSNDHLPVSTPLRHSQELQQSPVKAGSEPSTSLEHERPRKRRRVTLEFRVRLVQKETTSKISPSATMAQAPNLPGRLRQILSEKDWRDPTKSGSAMERLEKLHSRFQGRGELNHDHLKASSISLDNAKRLEVDWYSPMNKIFDLEGMPYDDPTKAPESATEAQELKHLNSEWRQRQNNHIKSMILLLEAFPGLIMRQGTKVPKLGEDQGDNQVYKNYLSFPFIDDQVDTSRPDLPTLLLEQDIEPDDDFVTSDTTSEVSSSAEEPTNRIPEVDGRKRKSTDKVTNKTAPKFSKAATRPEKQLSADHSKTPASRRRNRASLKPEIIYAHFESNPEVPETTISTPRSRTIDLNASRNQKALCLLVLSLMVLVLLLRWFLKTPTPTPTFI